jgi:CubicO group peptidase (beta-lactamase class C family)
LVEDGKLDLDAPIQQYCPQFPKKQSVITARMLLSHLAGFRNYYSSGANGEPRTTEAERAKLAELIKREESMQFTRYTDVIKPLENFKDEPLLYEPGTRFAYTSLSYRVLSCVLEGAAQTSFRALMHDLVFKPAGMSKITEDDSLAIVPHRVAGYGRAADKTLTRAPFRDVSENLAAGGYLSPAEDLVRFAVAFNSGKLVSAKSREQMLARPRLRDGTEVKNSFGMYYGMGIFVGSLTDGEPLLMHTGGQSGTSTELILLPRSDIAVAVMTNIDGWGGRDALAKNIAQIVGKQ